MRALQILPDAQAQFRDQCIVDQDNDGAGEYGCLGELTGAQPARGTGILLDTTPLLPTNLWTPDAQAVAHRSGYCFTIDVLDAGSRWVCYAWPNAIGQSGNRVFMMDETGTIYVSSNSARTQQYSFTSCVPAPNAALAPDGSVGVRRRNGTYPAGDGGVWILATD